MPLVGVWEIKVSAKEGQKAAGYDNVPPSNYNGGVPYGTPGSRAGILLNAAAKSAAEPSAAQAPASYSAASSSATPSSERRRARYDCAACHY